MQLALDALDGLVDTLEERGALSVVEAARLLFATGPVSEGLACELLSQVTAGDSRVVCRGTAVTLARGLPDPPLEEAEFVVFDLETTGLSAARNRICEVGAVRVRELEVIESFESLVNPRVPLPDPVARRLRAQHIEVDFTDEAVEHLAEVGFDPEFGARPLRRAIQRELENEVSRLLLGGRCSPRTASWSTMTTSSPSTSTREPQRRWRRSRSRSRSRRTSSRHTNAHGSVEVIARSPLQREPPVVSTCI